MVNKEVSLAICLFESIDDQNLGNVISLLGRHKANPNTIIPKLNIAPIHYAVGFEDEEFAEKITAILLENYADANLSELSDGLTPLMIASIWGREKIVKMLLDHSGDLDRKCNEGLDAISHAIRENHYGVIEIIKNVVFERKMEKKRKELKESNRRGSSIRNHLLQNLEEKQFTPNRINYNFDVTSPYYVNITHRKHSTSSCSNARKKLNIEQLSESDDETTADNDKIDDVKRNLFDLTEKNLKEFSKHMNNAIVVNRLAIHKRKSYIKKWQDSIKHMRKSDLKLDFEYIDYLNKCNDVKISADLKTFVDECESEESFFTATNDLKKLEKPAEVIEESYVHSDLDGGILLYEKKIVCKEEGADSDNSYLTELSLPLPTDYDTDALRWELKKIEGVNPVINKSTKKLFLKKLVKLRNTAEISSRKSTKVSKEFSTELQRAINNLNVLRENLGEWLELESRMARHFIERSNVKWREGNLKNSFIYFLIDPRISENLPLSYKSMSKEMIWQRFLDSIFYVGKGKRSRPYQHLYDAIKVFSRECVDNDIANRLKQTLKLDVIDSRRKEDKVDKLTNSKKISNIVDIWKSKKGVVCLHTFNNIMSVEAYTREAAIIEAIGLENLSNLKKGEYYGLAKNFSMRQKRQLGIALISRALRVYLAEGESQLLPFDII